MKNTCELQGAMSSGKSNRCVVLPADVPLLADSLEPTRNHAWIPKASSPADLIIQVDHSSFHLHKLAMISRSEYLNRLVFQGGCNIEISGDRLIIQLENIPGGRKAFELVVKFCYGWKIDITAENVAPLYCAAHFLEMSEELEEGNLISKTEAFLSFLILSSWKDTFRILKSCESILSWAKDLQIVKHCSEAIAWKACSKSPSATTYDEDYSKFDNSWWFEDVSKLRIDHFVEVIQCLKRGGTKSDLVGSCIQHWTMKWFSQFTLTGLDKVTPKHVSIQLHRVSTECLIRLLPTEVNSVSCNFLLHLLKAGVMLKIDLELLCVLERRIALMLDQCSVSDLLVKNQGDKGSLNDVDVVVRVLQCYVCHISKNSKEKMHAIGRLVDGYLIQVARDKNLRVESIKSLVEALPQDARLCDDLLYRAIDMYLKAHPELREDEREEVCKVLGYHRLSQEARVHVAKNNRLPVKLTTQFMLLEQVNMATRSVTSDEPNYRRTHTHTVIRVSTDFERRNINANEMKLMKRDVEVMKSQLLELNTCRIKLQKQLRKRCIW
ncbi:hypothetical protein HN51_054842 [Arachis hypogaea]|uniref:Root phototropism protein n=2 Tax=Arachis hypogaea TaxID=3818 RepID=A0A444XLN9_ARAHY|nr:root phototropism protein 3-like [Arachis ipaensis]XP_025674330.1 root phototropism protein 3-like [Arachis hypogaea]QHN77461.1 Root phototropism protein [Arachis hypogaea]RYQ90525.1 hypothetical protein Ahy_B09g096585 [Arachis hypogaea]